MGPVKRTVVLFVLLWLGGLVAPTRAEQQVAIGDATAALTGPWRFHTGDKMEWAQPGFDDSGWSTMDLKPSSGSYDRILGTGGFVPGWTARGYEGYAGYAWYRLQVRIENNGSPLALKMPDNVDDAYEIYVNGKRVGEFGRFTGHGVFTYLTQPRAFPMPPIDRDGVALVAIRMYMTPATPLTNPDAGGLHGAPVLGEAAAVGAQLQLDWNTIDRVNYVAFAEILMLLVAFLTASGLTWLDRREPAYLWLMFVFGAILAREVLYTWLNYTTWLDIGALHLLIDVLLIPATIGLWVIFWATWFRLQAIAWLQRFTWSLVFLLAVSTAMLRTPLYGGLVPAHASLWLSPLNSSLKLLVGVVLVWVTIRGLHKDRTEGWLALPAVLLVILSLYQRELIVLHIPTVFFPKGISVDLRQAGTILSSLIVTVLLLRRFLHAQKESEQWRLELEQARQLQHVLIPQRLPAVPGLTIESEYRPAHVVGGDFFQIIPDSHNGGVLIVAGDVTGHGLQAGMLVALLVGAIRSQADTSFDPLRMLESLNRRLCGRAEAHATCLALRIAESGAVNLANAGHLPPYLNATELPMEGALLLGMIEDAEFSVLHFQLQPGDRLTFISDGIVEAQDAQGQLFGFERIQEMLHTAPSQKPVSAADLATAAQRFGQQDDISVLTVLRAGPAGVETPIRMESAMSGPFPFGSELA